MNKMNTMNTAFAFKEQEELNSCITEFFVQSFDQNEWTEKTIRTRRKVRKLGYKIMDKTGRRPPLYVPESEEIKIIRYLVSSIRVDEMADSSIIRVRMLSQKGVDWCNGMWKTGVSDHHIYPAF